jgi:hypothetical protein
MSVDFMDFDRGQDVVVRGKRIPMLEAHLGDAGKVFLVFDRRIGLELDAGNYERVIDFIATVMENVMQPECGRTFNAMVELGAVESEEA